jgi:nucleoside-triphosphatase THEP1
MTKSNLGTPKDETRRLALDALREIRQAFAASGLSEEELQEEGRRVRKELVELRYGRRHLLANSRCGQVES